jgi:hypothetical protein
MPQKDEYRICTELLQLHPSRMRETSSSTISRMQPCERRRAKQAVKGPSGSTRTFFSKFTSPEQSYSAALCQDNHHQQTKALQTGEKRLSVQDPSLCNSNIVATVVHQIMTELTVVVSEEDRVMVITKMVLNATEWLLEFIGHSKS